MHRPLLIPLLALSLVLPGCVSTAKLIANEAQSLSTATPAQAATLSDAVLFATAATKAANLYAATAAHPSAAVLGKMAALSDAVHAALTDLEAANAQNKSLVFSSFNAAFAAFNAFAAAQGIKSLPTN